MKKIITLIIMITASFLAKSQTYTKDTFDTLNISEKKLIKSWCNYNNVIFPIWKDTTITDENKFEVHNWSVMSFNAITYDKQLRALYYETHSLTGMTTKYVYLESIGGYINIEIYEPYDVWKNNKSK